MLKTLNSLRKQEKEKYAVIGAHSGAGTLALFYKGKAREL